MQTVIQIQDAYIARRLACRTGHARRVAIGARKVAEAALGRLGFNKEQVDLMIEDARQMYVLEEAARD